MFVKAIINTEIAQTKATKPHDEKQSISSAYPAMTMTVEGMMNELHISRKTAYDLVKQNDFPAFRIGGRILVNRAGLQHWIDKRCAGNIE